MLPAFAREAYAILPRGLGTAQVARMVGGQILKKSCRLQQKLRRKTP